ncbi:hypothetical protein TNCV_1546621 [Trichonephila clavipes]|nr:hypothetical protein TNCV_1546621 [Trichonephila clavipes]
MYSKQSDTKYYENYPLMRFCKITVPNVVGYLNEIFNNVCVLLDCSIVSSEKFVAVDDDNVRTAPIMADNVIMEFVQSSKNIMDADSDEEN